jgi:hypothetical protein
LGLEKLISRILDFWFWASRMFLKNIIKELVKGVFYEIFIKELKFFG